MTTKQILYGTMMVACCWACSKNDEGEPSHIEKNWYTLTYDPNAGPLEQEIYKIYEDTGIPIFLSDTLGGQTRYNQGGEPYTYYNMFSPGYSYTSYNPTHTYSLERDEADLEAMVDLLGNYTLRPYFSKEFGEVSKGKFGPHALVILDSISRGTNKTPDTLLMDLGVIGLSTRYTHKTGTSSSASSFKGVQELTEEQKEKFGWCFAMYELKRYFLNTYEEEYTAYLNVLQTIPQNYTGTGTQSPFQLSETSNKSYNVNYYNMTDEPRDYGVLFFTRVNYYSNHYFPNWSQDLHSYMNMIYTMSDAEIRAEHGAFPYVIQRYEMLLAILNEAGLTQFIYKGE